MPEDIHRILKEYWGYDTFRPLQEDIIRTVLAGKDLLALLPTGGGKSLCFQVPGLAREGICLVVSPLIALMKDQVENLKKRNVLAAAIYTGMSHRQIRQTLENVSYGPYKFLYVSPERLETRLFLEYLPAMQVNLIAVDEAHCISQWGYDFRPSYLRIAALREQLRGVPVLALTASATPEVQEDICDRLRFSERQVLRPSFERKNLSYSLFTPEVKITRLQEVLRKVPGTAIVYCRSRRRTVEVAEALRLQGLSAGHYHAGLPAADRSRRQQEWIDNQTRVMVCTNAFGMGIDKPDVRVVLHADVPESLEHYYQEAGRAGRDGQRAYAVLLMNEKDKSELAALPDQRFPDLKAIRQVYGALVNYLQIPSYTGDETAFPFQFDPFVRNFKLEPTTALYALKALESDGWLDFNERSFLPSTLSFTTSKTGLYTFLESFPQFEALLTTLLRTYEGIFDVPVFIQEKTLARLLRSEEETVVQQLRALGAHGLVDYQPKSDTPQIIFRKHRVPAAELTFNVQAYNQRKEAFRRRLAALLGYLETKECRSRYINTYFGAATPDCGLCDNCLEKKRAPLTAEELHRISESARTALAAEPLPRKELLERLRPFGTRKAAEALAFLQAEEWVALDGAGKLVWRKGGKS